jgi:hypothetical protein
MLFAAAGTGWAGRQMMKAYGSDVGATGFRADLQPTQVRQRPALPGIIADLVAVAGGSGIKIRYWASAVLHRVGSART